MTKNKGENKSIIYRIKLLFSLRTILRLFNQSKSSVNKIMPSNTDNQALNNAAYPKFYKKFEDKFRGPEEDVIEKLRFYLSYFKDFEKTNNVVIDIGCGRGEFLNLMASESINAIGIDLDKDMVEHSRLKGYDAILADATEFLSKDHAMKIGGITGFHVIEHIPYENLLQLFHSCYKSLEPDGFVIFETPNPESLLVGTSNFYLDPSHLKPIPPPLIKFTLESIGFINNKIIYLHPYKNVNTNHLDPLVAEVVRRYYGARDYAVIGYKPSV